jgi:hypothetical protein
MPIVGKNKEVIRIECWKNPPVPVYAGTDADGKVKLMHVRPKVEPGWKCADWKERMMGFW